MCGVCFRPMISAIYDEDRAFGNTNGQIILNAEFRGEFALEYSNNAQVLESTFYGDDAFFGSKGAKVICCGMFGKDNFGRAHDIMAFIDGDVSMHIPHSGIVAVRGLEEYVFSPRMTAGAIVYTAKISGQSKVIRMWDRLFEGCTPPIRLVKKEYFDKHFDFVDFKNLESVLKYAENYRIK